MTAADLRTLGWFLYSFLMVPVLIAVTVVCRRMLTFESAVRLQIVAQACVNERMTVTDTKSIMRTNGFTLGKEEGDEIFFLAPSYRTLEIKGTNTFVRMTTKDGYVTDTVLNCSPYMMEWASW
jgi:hypothetical protein